MPREKLRRDPRALAAEGPSGKERERQPVEEDFEPGARHTPLQ